MAIKHGERFLFWTKLPDESRNGALVTVRVFVDLDECMCIARRAVKNRGRKAVQRPARAEALSGDIDIISEAAFGRKE